MSIELLLIPIGLTVYAAIREYRDTTLCEKCRTTTVTDLHLLDRALQHLGATGIEHLTEQVVVAHLGGRAIRFQKAGEAIIGRVDEHDDETDLLVNQVNVAAGLVSQRDTIEAMRLRAAELGLRLVGEETAEDGTVQLLFEEVTDGH